MDGWMAERKVLVRKCCLMSFLYIIHDNTSMSVSQSITFFVPTFVILL